MHICDVDVVARRRWNCSTIAFLDMVYLVLVVMVVKQEMSSIIAYTPCAVVMGRTRKKKNDILNRID